MKLAIIYKSLTGNTKMVADAIAESLKDLELVYVGEPVENIDADLYFVGTWIDKGNCTKEIADYLSTLEGKRVAIFATAGFGGSKEYYDVLLERIKDQIPKSNQLTGQFFCQGKMPMSVRERYVSMMQANPEDKNLEVSIKNFDEALSHPDHIDLAEAVAWANSLLH